MLLYLLENFPVSALNGKKFFSFFCKFCFLCCTFCILRPDLFFVNLSDFFLLFSESLYSGSYSFLLCLKSLKGLFCLFVVFFQISVFLLFFLYFCFQNFFSCFQMDLSDFFRRILLLFFIFGCFHRKTGLFSVTEVLFFLNPIFFFLKILQKFFHSFLSFCVFPGFPDFSVTFFQKISALFFFPVYHKNHLFPHGHEIPCLTGCASAFLTEPLKIL